MKGFEDKSSIQNDGAQTSRLLVPSICLFKKKIGLAVLGLRCSMWDLLIYGRAGLCCCVGFSLVPVHGLLTLVASLVAEQGL